MHRRMRFIFARVSFLLPGAAGAGVNLGFDSFGLDGGGAGFVSVLGGGSASFRVSGGGGEVSLGLSIAWSPAFFEPSRLGV